MEINNGDTLMLVTRGGKTFLSKVGEAAPALDRAEDTAAGDWGEMTADQATVARIVGSRTSVYDLTPQDLDELFHVARRRANRTGQPMEHVMFMMGAEMQKRMVGRAVSALQDAMRDEPNLDQKETPR